VSSNLTTRARTEEGRELKRKIFATATDLFLNYKRKDRIVEAEYQVIN